MKIKPLKWRRKTGGEKGWESYLDTLQFDIYEIDTAGPYLCRLEITTDLHADIILYEEDVKIAKAKAERYWQWYVQAVIDDLYEED